MSDATKRCTCDYLDRPIDPNEDQLPDYVYQCPDCGGRRGARSEDMPAMRGTDAVPDEPSAEEGQAEPILTINGLFDVYPEEDHGRWAVKEGARTVARNVRTVDELVTAVELEERR